MSVPSTMRAVVMEEGKTVAVKEVPTPALEDNDILVKVEAIAQNPIDWKCVDSAISPPGAIIGCDFSGTVVKLGNATRSGVTIGDHVAGFVLGGQYKDRGTFATYLKADSDLVWVVPKNTLSHEEASTTGCALWTVVQAFYHPTRLALAEPPSKASPDTWVFIYGGSTSVGLYAIQLAHLSGYKVVTVASPHNHAYLKSLGADAVFDYKSPDVVSQIKQATGNSLHYGLDTHSVGGSQSLSVSAFGPGPGKLVVALDPDEDARKLRPDIEVQQTTGFTALGLRYNLGVEYPPSAEDRAHMVQFLPKLGGIVQAGSVKPNPIKLWEGGLEAVKAGFEYMKQGKLSAQKIVCRV